MAKVSVYILIFLLSLQGADLMLSQAGLYDEVEVVRQDTGNATELQDARSDAESFDVSGGLGETLFGLYNSLASVLSGLVNFVAPGAAMLKRVGVPALIVNFTVSVFIVVPALDLISFLRSGGELL